MYIVMTNWTNPKPCTNCGRGFGTMIKCEKYGTIGCNDGKCITSNAACGVCRKQSKKIKIWLAKGYVK